MSLVDRIGSLFRLRPAQAVLALPLALLFPPALTAAPPGDLPFGAYDPEGFFASDGGLTIEHVFLPWEDVDLNSLLQADLYALERGRALMITVEPWTWTRDERNTPEFLRRGIREGYYDANMRGVCSVIGTLQSPVSVRWGHEMDTVDGQFIWSDWQPADYIEAYQRMIGICRDAAPNANFVWSPMGFENASDFYPGDDHVDLVGLSIFGLEPWETQILGGARTFDEILTERYDRVKVHGKPVIVAELGYSGSAGYVEGWETSVRKERPDMPLLVGVVYFNQAEVYAWPDGFGLPDWRVENRVLP